MYKIGCVNIDTSHPGSFAGKMKDFELDMRYSCIFNDGFRSDKEVENFMENHSIEKRYESLEEMANHVDIAFIHDCNWDKHIDHAMPFIKAGKPVFLDKPIVGSLKDCFRLKELEKKGAVILGSSSARYVECLVDLKNKITDAGETIATVFGTSGVDEFNYGVHIMEGIHGLLGNGAYSTRYLGVSNSVEKQAEQYLTKWKNGVQVIYQTQTGQWQPFHVVVTTDKAIHHVQVDTGKLYISLLKKIEAFLKDGVQMSSMDDLVETVKIYLAGKKSRESHGEEIALQSLSVTDAGYDGYAFEKEYSIANMK
jgi:hypothetical protein